MVELRLHHIHQKIKHHGTYSTDLGEERSLAQSDPRNVSENDTKREVCSKLLHLPNLIHYTQNIHDSLEPARW